MKTSERILYFFVLPILAVLLFPPQMLISGFGVVIVALVFFIGLGALILRGRELALTFAIFLQGMNVIIRIMMFWTNGFSRSGQSELGFILTTIASVILSCWLLLRLDHQDIRVQMTR
jgi:hypothetical protein